MKIVALSDTHGQHNAVKIPKCDVLIFAGDWTAGVHAQEQETWAFAAWLSKQPAKHKIVIAGNHELVAEQKPDVVAEILGDVSTYLIDRGAIIDGVYFWGSPYTPAFNNWAFGYPPQMAGAQWAKIPPRVDVLVTHGPPKGVLDMAFSDHYGPQLGCPELLDKYSPGGFDIAPKIHIFGHIHDSGGGDSRRAGTRFYNVSVLNESYRLVRGPRVIMLDTAKCDL